MINNFSQELPEDRDNFAGKSTPPITASNAKAFTTPPPISLPQGGPRRAETTTPNAATPRTPQDGINTPKFGGIGIDTPKIGGSSRPGATGFTPSGNTPEGSPLWASGSQESPGPSDAAAIEESYARLARNHSRCLRLLYESCHISEREMRGRMSRLGISEEPTAENVMRQQKEVSWLNSRIPLVLLVNARDHVLLLLSQVQGDPTAQALQEKLQEELQKVSVRLHKGLLAWESKQEMTFAMNGTRCNAAKISCVFF